MLRFALKEDEKYSVSITIMATIANLPFGKGRLNCAAGGLTLPLMQYPILEILGTPTCALLAVHLSLKLTALCVVGGQEIALAVQERSTLAEYLQQSFALKPVRCIACRLQTFPKETKNDFIYHLRP